MTDINPFDESEAPAKDLVRVTLKADKGYDAPWITVDGSTPAEILGKFDDSLVKLMQEAAKAASSFKRFWEAAQRDVPSQPGQYGKPQGANTPANGDLPFADSNNPPTSAPSTAPAELPDNKCKHGDRSLVKYKGQSGWVCPQPKDSTDRCATVMVA